MGIVPTGYSNKSSPVDNDSLWGYDSEGIANSNFLLSAIKAYVLTGLTTSVITEGSNLYYTDARVTANSTVVSLGVDKADKSNVLELDNTTAYVPTAPYHPATMDYVDNIAIPQGASDADVDAATNETKFVNPKQVKSLMVANVIIKDTSDASVTTTYSHSLGKIPRYIEVQFELGGATLDGASSNGIWDGVDNKCIFTEAGANNSSISSAYSLYIQTNTSILQRGIIENVTSTSFDVEWEKIGSPTGTGAIIFKLYY